MLNNLPPKKTIPLKLSQIKCQAPRVETSVNESKEWQVLTEKESEQKVESGDKNSVDKETCGVGG